MALSDSAFNEWFADLQHRMVSLPDGDFGAQIAVFAKMLPESLQQHRLMLRLLPILHTVLEHNIPYAAALDFKQQLRNNLVQTGALIEKKIVFLQAGQGAELLLHAYAALIGLQSMAQPSVVVSQILQLPEMTILMMDENTALEQIVSRLLNGLYLENKR